MGKYEEALERAKQGLPIDEVFPELKESEDERIKNAIGATICGTTAISILEANGTNLPDALAYLEKQKDLAAIPDELVKNYKLFCENGRREISVLINAINGINEQKEQKPAETSNIDLDTKVNDWVGYMLNDNAQSYSRKNVQILLDNCARFFYDYAVMCLDKPAEWSEEDEDYLVDVESAVNDYFDERYAEELCTWLKSLRHQPHWKPNEKQIQVFKQTLTNFIEDCIAENLENTTPENKDNHEGYHQACWDILYFIKQASK